MLFNVLLVLLAATLFYCVKTYRAYRRGIATAKASGIPYVVMPVYLMSPVWLLLTRVFGQSSPRLLQQKYPQLYLLAPDWAWHLGYKVFENMGSDTFLTIAGERVVFYTCSPSVIMQVTGRRVDFPKPIRVYAVLNLYGTNVISTEGAVWRQHRKVTAPPFADRNNELVWSETLDQTQALIKSWIGDGHKDRAENVADDSSKLALNIISRAGFGVRLAWPDADADPLPSDVPATLENIGDNVLSNGHTMTYRKALDTLLHKVYLVLVVPHSWLKHSPFKSHNQLLTAFHEWGQYMNQILTQNIEAVQEKPYEVRKDLIGTLASSTSTSKETSEGKSSKGAMLSWDETIGNMFIFIIAGHETSANLIHLCLVMLACNPYYQARLQQDLDDIFGDRPPTEWDYYRDVPKLFGGVAGAILNEILRLFPSVINIPKCTHDSPQSLTLDNGRRVFVPANTYMNLSAVAVHRHPKYWPTVKKDDINTFQPDRWLLSTTKDNQSQAQPLDNPSSEAADGPSGPDVSSTLFRPTRGAFIPFSEGPRSCLGRRFSQVEVLAALARIFYRHSVELAVDEWASVDEVDKMPRGGPERTEVWGKAKARADLLTTKGMATTITLQMKRGKVPIRVVERGQEKFVGV